MTHRVVIAGASGFIGHYLTEAYRAAGSDVALIGRPGGRADATWGDTAAIAALLDDADLLINLAGKSVNCRYTPANRAEILRSRIETTNELARAVTAAAAPPRLWINSSTATIYRHADDRPMTESTGEIGAGFSVSIATQWEKAFFAADLPGTRRVALRMAIVLGDGSALAPLIGLTRAGLGGPQLDGRWFSTRARRAAGTFHEYRPRSKNGRQKFSWVHIDDVLQIIRFLEQHESLDGVINAAAPFSTDNRGFMRTLRRVLGVRFAMAASRWMLELGSHVIKTETELVLKSRWVLPERLLDAGYTFRFARLEPALRDIVDTRSATSSAPEEGQ
ncbi:MAG: NAD-dependent epimerase [Subtercola sp.]|nr:NAD-dependent epimerase [Subtercola sp.]